jgi:hypothetical protein
LLEGPSDPAARDEVDVIDVAEDICPEIGSRRPTAAVRW